MGRSHVDPTAMEIVRVCVLPRPSHTYMYMNTLYVELELYTNIQRSVDNHLTIVYGFMLIIYHHLIMIEDTH